MTELNQNFSDTSYDNQIVGGNIDSSITNSSIDFNNILKGGNNNTESDSDFYKLDDNKYIAKDNNKDSIYIKGSDDLYNPNIDGKKYDYSKSTSAFLDNSDSYLTYSLSGINVESDSELDDNSSSEMNNSEINFSNSDSNSSINSSDIDIVSVNSD